MAMGKYKEIIYGYTGYFFAGVVVVPFAKVPVALAVAVFPDFDEVAVETFQTEE